METNKEHIAENFSKLFSLLYGINANKHPELTNLQVHILDELIQSTDGISMSQMANRLAICKQQLTPLICKLENKDYVQKNQDPTDRRIAKLTLSEKGTDIIKCRMKEMSEKLGQLDEADLADLEYATSKVIRIVEKLR